MLPRLLAPVVHVLCFSIFLSNGQIVQKTLHKELQRFGGERSHLVLIDAGSSGSKLFAFAPEKTSAKLLTVCSEKHRNDGYTNQGIAALAYTKDECGWLVGSSGDDATLKAIAEPAPDYANALLGLLAETYEKASGQSDDGLIKNRDAVPMLATAGMRLVSQEKNEQVWSYLCGKSHAGLTLASAGSKCGTIPGTMEAYYEFLANAAKGRKSRVLTGTFTVGGASAQIAIPLKKPVDVESFQALRQKVSADLDCTKLRIPDGSQAPFFNTVKEGGPTKECLDDYITYMPKDKIRASQEVKEKNIKVDEIQGLGLISFLGLRGQGSFVAGGVNEIQHWAEQEGCDAAKTTFEECSEKLRSALSRDVMWKHVRAYFKEHALDINSFSYNTYAAQPEAAGLPDVDGQDQAWELEEELAKKCEPDNSVRFGYKDHSSCMSALYTSLFITSFFKQNGDEEDHVMKELHWDPKRDWAEGKVEEALSFMQLASGATRQEERTMADDLSLRSLLKVPLRRHSASYSEGAAMHLGAGL